ncbi:MAG: hypothetical protein JXJ17_15165 [Anaerolineae bacterium]|nr:hypothetical protein [Anaerolineae bacterium]
MRSYLKTIVIIGTVVGVIELTTVACALLQTDSPVPADTAVPVVPIEATELATPTSPVQPTPQPSTSTPAGIGEPPQGVAPEGFTYYVNETYQFRFIYPEEWEVNEVDVELDEPGNPVEYMIMFTGSNPTNLPPFDVTVTVGTWEDFAGIFLTEAVLTEDMSINTNPGYRIDDSHRQRYYVLEDPENSDVRIVFSIPIERDGLLLYQVLDSFRWWH